MGCLSLFMSSVSFWCHHITLSSSLHSRLLPGCFPIPLQGLHSQKLLHPTLHWMLSLCRV